MGSSYLVKISGICADIATKLMIDAPSDEKSATQVRSEPRGSQIARISGPDTSSSWRASAVRDDAQDVWSTYDRLSTDAGEPVDMFQFATFMRDLDALRMRMLAGSFCDPVSQVQSEISEAAVGDDGDDCRRVTGQELAPVSVVEAIASAVLLLPHGPIGVHRAR